LEATASSSGSRTAPTNVTSTIPPSPKSASRPMRNVSRVRGLWGIDRARATSLLLRGTTLAGHALARTALVEKCPIVGCHLSERQLSVLFRILAVPIEGLSATNPDDGVGATCGRGVSREQPGAPLNRATMRIDESRMVFFAVLGTALLVAHRSRRPACCQKPPSEHRVARLFRRCRSAARRWPCPRSKARNAARTASSVLAVRARENRHSRCPRSVRRPR
jgi:hypothetical protein